MKKFNVMVEACYNTLVEVEAEDPQDAKSKVNFLINDGMVDAVNDGDCAYYEALDATEVAA